MASLNKVQLIGNLGRDPEVRNFQNGDKVCNLNIATSETWKDKATGEKREKTEWHRVAVFGGLAGVCERYLRKGSSVYLAGQLETRKWQDQAGADRYSTEIVLRPYRGEMIMLGAASGRDGGAPGGDAGRGDPVGASGAPSRDLDDEIPF